MREVIDSDSLGLGSIFRCTELIAIICTEYDEAIAREDVTATIMIGIVDKFHELFFRFCRMSSHTDYHMGERIDGFS
jgi:hypothetical protein